MWMVLVGYMYMLGLPFSSSILMYCVPPTPSKYPSIAPGPAKKPESVCGSTGISILLPDQMFPCGEAEHSAGTRKKWYLRFPQPQPPGSNRFCISKAKREKQQAELFYSRER